MSVTKWSGTLAHPNHNGNLVGTTICAFAHFAYIFSQRSVVFADIQGVFNQSAVTRSLTSHIGTQTQLSPGVEGLILFDVMTHTVAG